MMNKLYVGNLRNDVDGAALQELFAEHGTVFSVQVVADRRTGESKDFGFVLMGNQEEAMAAIAALNGRSYKGRPLSVDVAATPEQRRQYNSPPPMHH